MLSHTDQDYPIPAGEVLALSCEEDFQLIGSPTLTCQNGQHYYYEEGEGEPKCEPTPESGKFSLVHAFILRTQTFRFFPHLHEFRVYR